MKTRLISIKQASKDYGFPQQKLYQLVKEKEVPFIELKNLSGTTTKKINTRTFEEWLDSLSLENKIL